MNTFRSLPKNEILPGDPAPWFQQRSLGNPNFVFNVAGGRYLVLCFFGSGSDPLGREAIAAVTAHKNLFGTGKLYFFGVSTDPADEATTPLARLSGMDLFWDFDGKVSRLYGAIPKEAAQTAPVPQNRFWLVLDPALRVMAKFPFTANDSGAAEVFAFVKQLPAVDMSVGFQTHAPVLVVPNVFEPEFCKDLIAQYETHGGEESGFMRQQNGKTVAVSDHSFKRRKDYTITDPDLIAATQARIIRRIVPEILKVHFFKITRMERYIVCCYAAEDKAHFSAHRDNTTHGTAHRRFAVSINLNAEFEGGEVSFPEYGPRSYKPPVGGAVIFSCSLLHAVSTVTSGRRYAFLPFLYDDEAAKIREANNKYLDQSVAQYNTGQAAPAPEAAAAAAPGA